MKDVCIIPTHERPEFLWITLEKILAATNRENIEFWICEDVHYEKSTQLQTEILSVLNYAKDTLLDVKHFQTRHTNHGSSYNVLTSFQRACETEAESIFFIEDDVRVTKDFFRFCYAAQEEFKPFFVTGNCAPMTGTQDPAGIVLSDTWGQTFSMCFKRDKLKGMLNPNYVSYAIQPTSEWDNYLLRYMQKTNQFAACACVQRGYHFGFHSYHAGKNLLIGDLKDRVAQTRAILDNPRSANLDRNAYQVGQIGIPYPSKEPEWDRLYRAGSTVRQPAIRIPIPFGVRKDLTSN